ncbi:hypothetical protein EKG39_04035 [Shewanella atlantica]|uniref:Uncharacterized protein n=1 Tax=Shewanella atlantica TaxID=271099 RepID=A0A3S0LGF1_9GAMM|nr:hypothetical protein EKG39_04035 [Shewanella atlantica]
MRTQKGCRDDSPFFILATGYGLRATGYGLRATGYGLRATGYGLRATGYEVGCSLCRSGFSRECFGSNSRKP